MQVEYPKYLHPEIRRYQRRSKLISIAGIILSFLMVALMLIIAIGA